MKQEPVQSNLEYSSADILKLRKNGQVTRSGVVYDEELAGPGGMSFVLLQEPDTTDAMLAAAVHQLRSDRDVVGSIKVASVLAGEIEFQRPSGG